MVRPEGFEPPASWFVARRSIQLSYGRAVRKKIDTASWRRGRDCELALVLRTVVAATTSPYLFRYQMPKLNRKYRSYLSSFPCHLAEREGFEPSKGF